MCVDVNTYTLTCITLDRQRALDCNRVVDRVNVLRTLILHKLLSMKSSTLSFFSFFTL